MTTKQIHVGKDQPPLDTTSSSPNRSSQQTPVPPISHSSFSESVLTDVSAPLQSLLDLMFSDSDPEEDGEGGEMRSGRDRMDSANGNVFVNKPSPALQLKLPNYQRVRDSIASTDDNVEVTTTLTS